MPTLTAALCAAAALYAAYGAALVVYRLFLSPLRHVPGPRLAAATLWYEFYFDVWKRGRFEFEIMRLHEIYGPLVRISPHELHCADPNFIPVLYSGSGARRDKYAYLTHQFGNSESFFGTVSHDLHRMRRAPLNPFFSKASVTKLEPVIRAMVLKLADQLNRHAGSGDPVCLTMAYGCMTTDIVTQYAFTRTYNFLESPTFETNFHRAIVGATKLGPLFKQFPALLPFLQSLPDAVIKALSKDFASQIDFRKDMKRQINEIKAKGPKTDPDAPSTIFEEVLNTPKLPDREKTAERLWQDAATVIGAGTETTAWTLSAMTLFVLKNETVFKKLMAELLPIMPAVDDLPSVAELEKLPFLTAVIMESLRLSYGISTRLQRVAAEPLTYHPSDLVDCAPELKKSIVIPPGTPVGMSALQIHHNEVIFPDSWSFRPERWLKDDGKDAPRLDRYLMSFSKGTRQCIGINLAFAELYATTAMVVRRFGSRMTLFETSYEDNVRCEEDYFVPVPKIETGVRVTFSKP